MRKLIMISNTIVMTGWPWKCFDALCFDLLPNTVARTAQHDAIALSEACREMGAHRIVMPTSYSCSTGHGSKQSERPRQTSSRKAARHQRQLLAGTTSSRHHQEADARS
jgi:hypothetical protein